MQCSQAQLMRACSECYLLLEQYKLRANLVGINMEKEFIEPTYLYLEERVTERYMQLFQRLKDAVARLEVHFRLAQANALRTLNNILRNYRRRVGTLANEPLTSLKYARYERQEKMLLESIVYGERENAEEVAAFRGELERSLEAAAREVEEKYRRNERIREDYSVAFQIVDKSECYSLKHYQGFEQAMLASAAGLEAHFDKLNGFLSVWENVGSTKAYEARSARELEGEERTHEGGERRLRGAYEEETEEQLEQLMRNCPQHSPQREEYRKRLNELRRYNSEKQKKLDLVGKMYSKRRNRPGILVSRGKEVCILEWLINLDNSKVPYSHADEFKHYRADNDHSEYRPTPYENHRPFRTAEEAREHLDRHRPAVPLNHEWWYDRFGGEGTLDLIAGESQQVQKRIQFEVVRQVELQSSDDRRKRELMEKQAYQMKENERRDGLHVGYRHVHDKDELQALLHRTYDTQYIPGVTHHRDISFSDDEPSSSHTHSEEEDLPAKAEDPNPKRKEAAIKLDFPLIKLEDPKAKTVPEAAPLSLAPKQEVAMGPKQEARVEEQGELPFEQQIISTYFREYSKKMTRKEEEPEYKKTGFLYFREPGAIDWSLLSAYTQHEKIFIYTPRSILFFSRIFSATQERVKCGVYAVQGEGEEGEEEAQEAIRRAVQGVFEGVMVTVRFHPIYLESEDVTAFMMGLLVVLVREGKMFEDSETKDYVNEGREIIEDFSEYYFPSEIRNTKSLFMRKFMPQNSHEMFAPKKQPPASTTPTISTTTTTPTDTRSTLSSLKNEKNAPKVEPKPKEIERREPEVKKAVEKERPPPEFAPYSRLEQLPLKRSNSRELLGAASLQLEMGESGLGEQGESGEEDYSQL